ncbi:unnamed protein product, partial [marine sediment metagenome]
MREMKTINRVTITILIGGLIFWGAGELFAAPPVLDPIGPKSVDEGQLLQFTIPATDSDNDLLTYSASPLPAGASLVKGGPGWLTGWTYRKTITIDNKNVDSD